MAKGAHTWFKKITWQEAEKIAGSRLDRRRQYYIHTEEGRRAENPYAFNGSYDMPDAKLFAYVEGTRECSGCSCDCGEGYGCSHGAAGCEECGYTGKRREGMHSPINLDEIMRGDKNDQ